MSSQSRTSIPVDYSSSDRYITAEEVFPIKIPLEKVDVGRVKYIADTEGDLFDIELVYEMHTSDILVRSNIASVNSTVGPGTFRIKGIRAAKLDLINEIPGSLEGIMSRLVLEMDQDVQLEKEGDKALSGSKLKCHRVILTASVHETGHLRDILLFLKLDKKIIECFEKNDKNLYINYQRQASKASIDLDDSIRPSLTFMEVIPWWSIYIPWQIYSSKFRRLIQMFLLLYTIFTILWASWQLYRHVDIIQTALQPLVKMLHLYLSGVMIVLDKFLRHFTHYWTCLLSPLNVLRSIFLLPVWNLVLQLRTIVIPMLVPLTHCFTPFSRCLSVLWKAIIDSKLAVQSIDMSKLQQSFVFNLIFSCLRAFFNCIAKLVGYSKNKSRQRQAIKDQTKIHKSVNSSTAATCITQREQYKHAFDSVPVYYKSPLVRDKYK